MKNLLQALESQKEAERIYAIQDIVELKEPDFARPLLNRLKIEKSQAVKDSIKFCLKNMSCTKIYTELFELFHSMDAFQRNAAVELFGSEGGAAVAFLASHLNEKDKEVRKLILDALYATKSSDAINAIRSGLRDPSENVKIAAVEYLGLLSDRDSSDDLLEMLEFDDEPMLKITILESLLNIGDNKKLKEALSILISDGDIKNIDLLYLPQILTLLVKTDNKEPICILLDSLEDIEIYADDIIRAFRKNKDSITGILRNESLLAKILDIIKNILIRPDVRHAAVDLLLETKLVSQQALYNLGIELMKEEAMLLGSIRLLEASGAHQGLENIKTIMETTSDVELQVLCEDIINTVRT
jgi:hypothetical protein